MAQGCFRGHYSLIQEMVEGKIPVIAAGGIYRPRQIKTMLTAGAIAVQLDTVLWRGDLDLDKIDPGDLEGNQRSK